MIFYLEEEVKLSTFETLQYSILSTFTLLFPLYNIYVSKSLKYSFKIPTREYFNSTDCDFLYKKIPQKKSKIFAEKVSFQFTFPGGYLNIYLVRSEM